MHWNPHLPARRGIPRSPIRHQEPGLQTFPEGTGEFWPRPTEIGKLKGALRRRRCASLTDPESWNSRFRSLHQAPHIGDRWLQRGGEERARGGGSSPRSSSPSLNWPLSLIRGCRSSSGCTEELIGAGLGAGAAVEGAWPRGGGRGTPGPGGLRRSLPGAGSMAPGLQIPRGEADRDGDTSPKCQGPRARRESFTPTAVSGRSAASSACGGGWGRRCRRCAPPPGAGVGGRDPPRGAEPGHRDQCTQAGGEGGPRTVQTRGSRGNC